MVRANNLQQFIQAQWQKRGWWAWLMSPLGMLVCGVAAIKRHAYQQGWRKQTQLCVPVIVVGNIYVGGSGKSPLVAYIANSLSENGYQPGIICRGYKGKSLQWPQSVSSQSDPVKMGDEAVMLAQQTGLPVVAGPNRAQAAQHLLDEFDCDVVISDDGFQHLKLARDIDIVVSDAARGFGNGWCLPAGPLREGISALQSADIQIIHGAEETPVHNQAYIMTLMPSATYGLGDTDERELAKNMPFHAIAGIGDPARFFTTLRDAGYTIIEHAFADHHAYQPADLNFDDDYDLITTEKDAIKLASMQLNKIIWVLPVRAKLSAEFDASLLAKLKRVSHD